MRLVMLVAAILTVCSLTVINAELCDPIPGVRQSPVNIDPNTILQETANPLKWSDGYQTVADWITLVDDGHSLKLQANISSAPILTGGQLPVPYTFQQLHFHWGVDDSKGSEHKINQNTYPLEMHVVHTQESNSDVDQYVVVSYFFRVARRLNRSLQNVLDAALVAAANRNQPINVQPFALVDLVSTGSFSYYTYKGSLTTPPYTESVTWIIATSALPISESQLEVFRQAAEIDEHMQDNFRCLQDLNGRTISLVGASEYFYRK